jgi:hypothetical protein
LNYYKQVAYDEAKEGYPKKIAGYMTSGGEADGSGAYPKWVALTGPN